MSLLKYYYNPKTCRYETVQISIVVVIGYAFLFSISTVLILIGGLFLHSKLFTTEKGQALRQENAVLKKHHASLQQEVSTIEGVLVNLKHQDANLNEKLFETPLVNTNSISPSKNRKAVLEADESNFASEFHKVKDKSTALSKISLAHNTQFATFKITPKELVFLISVPSILPVENTALTKLVSGFGTRINPFHKGNYDHSGADFAAPHGTSIVATGNGKVIAAVKGSSLQAGYGNYVKIDHGNGLITLYAHMETVAVRMGQRVKKGYTIGTVGMTGGTVAPHVHYEIIRNGEQVDPVPFMMENLSSTAYTELLKLGNKKNQSLD